jgi:hypothetical protein
LREWLNSGFQFRWFNQVLHFVTSCLRLVNQNLQRCWRSCSFKRCIQWK